MLAFGWLVNCGVLPIGAARADGSPLVAGCCDQAELATGGAVDEDVGSAVGGESLVGVAAAVAAGRWKFALLPPPAQPVSVPAARTIPAVNRTVRIMRSPLRAHAAEQPPGRNPFRRCAAAAARSSLSAAGM
jgi:hypothetical protein